MDFKFHGENLKSEEFQISLLSFASSNSILLSMLKINDAFILMSIIYVCIYTLSQLSNKKI